ncbi:nuclear receptor subfamily 1 group D member 2-like [Saccoglossus kowalevskii]|uniref:Uncharacterized protein LOC100370954 n=1 Tax=Saccoglossus kowalevskii TaxID=10224 RepID=A0ABM0GP95_SACKO|nr:PREDICTED: uncharacterized protein LOC100370954 [Saccoglossus kowalevskii]
MDFSLTHIRRSKSTSSSPTTSSFDPLSTISRNGVELTTTSTPSSSTSLLSPQLTSLGSQRQHISSSTHQPSDGGSGANQKMLPGTSSESKSVKPRHKDQLNELISCQICGDTSTGFHYGVHSCEGCKGFFRRSISQHTSYTCTNKEMCDISIYTRNQCQLCRWRKCCSVGMSKDASRLGRRSKRMIERMQDMITKTPKDEPDKRIKTARGGLQRNEYMHQSWGSQELFDNVIENTGKQSVPQYNCNFKDMVNVKSEQIGGLSTCLYENMGIKQILGGFKQPSDKSPTDEDSKSGLPMSPKQAGFISSSSLSDINGISVTAINEMLSAGQPVILIPQQIGKSPALGMSVQGQIPPAVVVVKPSEPLKQQVCPSPVSPFSELSGFINKEQKSSDCAATSSGYHSSQRQTMTEMTNYTSLNSIEPEYTKPKPSPQSIGSPQQLTPSLRNQATTESVLKQQSAQQPSPCGSLGSSFQLSPFLSSPISSPGKNFLFDTPTPSPDESASTKSPVVINFPDINTSTLSSEEVEQLEVLLHSIAKSHHDNCHFTYARIRILKKRYFGIEESEYSSRGRKLHDCSNCPPPPDFPTSELPPRELTMSEDKITATHMIRFFADKFTGLITRIVVFTKQIPGFRMLDKEDQIILIKAGLFEVSAVRFTTVIDTNSNMVNYWTTGDRFSRELARQGHLGKVIDLLFELAGWFNELELTDDEVGCLNAVIMVAADRPGLKKREDVLVLQTRLLKVLQLELKRTHPDRPDLFTQVLTIIPKLREIGPEHTRRLMELKIQNPKVPKLSALHAEVFDLVE